MNSIIEQMAIDKGIAIDEVTDIFTRFSSLLAGRLPELKQVIEDVVKDEKYPDKFKEHISKMTTLLEEKKEEVFKTWSMPHQSFIFRHNANGMLF